MSKYYGLIMQDLMLQKANLLHLILIPVGVIGYLKTGSLLLITMMAYFQTQFLLVNACGLEETNKSRIIFNCLPLSKKHIILSKYICIFIYYIIVTSFYYLSTFLFNLLGLGKSGMDINDCVIVLCLVATSVVLFYPLYFRLGYPRASAYSSLFPMLFIMFDMTKINSVSKEDPYDKIKILMNSHGEVRYLLIGLIVVIFSMSYWTSLKMYRNQDL